MQEDDETRFLCGYKNLPRYGTTAGLPSTKSLYNKIVVHQLTPSDTLQGLALKYNSSITEIKRLNKLWSNDSMYLRDSLKIPVISSSVSSTSRGDSFGADSVKKILRNPHDSFASIHSDSEILHDCRNNNNDLKDEDRSQSLNEQNDVTSSAANVMNNRPSSSLSSTSRQSDTTFDKSEEAFSDIFHRIDSTLKATAKNVRRIEAQSSVEKIADEAYLAMIDSTSSRSYDNKTARSKSKLHNESNVVDFSPLRKSDTNDTGRFWSIKNGTGGKKTAAKEFVQMSDMTSSSSSRSSSYQI